jgi:hypothetical protein
MEFLKEDLELATYDVRDFKYREERSAIPVIEEKLDLVVDHYATVSGKRVFIMPNIFTRTHRKLKATESRSNDLVLGFEYTDVDSAEIILPAGYMPESLPQDVRIESKFGKYVSGVKFMDDKLYYHRSIEHNSGRFPASDYKELVNFYETIYKADRSKVVLVKK